MKGLQDNTSHLDGNLVSKGFHVPHWELPNRQLHSSTLLAALCLNLQNSVIKCDFKEDQKKSLNMPGDYHSPHLETLKIDLAPELLSLLLAPGHGLSPQTPLPTPAPFRKRGRLSPEGHGLRNHRPTF